MAGFSFGSPSMRPAQCESNFKALLSMRLPHPLLSNEFFQFSRLGDLLAALSGEIDVQEEAAIRHLVDLRLPPITSQSALSAIFGFNPGFVWNLLNKKNKYYRRFEIPKGNTVRVIHAPRVGLKLIQKWISIRLGELSITGDDVFGFVPGRSHVDASRRHCGAKWVFSCDIENFFPSTSARCVRDALVSIGYDVRSAGYITEICCYEDGLAQGSPASPVLSNICAMPLDLKFVQIRNKYGCTFTRYADDIVFSGVQDYPEGLAEEVLSCFEGTVWTVAESKTLLSKLPGRLKVHGLLVHGEYPRLTKGYRNRIRAYRYLEAAGKVLENKSIIEGHLSYANSILKPS